MAFNDTDGACIPRSTSLGLLLDLEVLVGGNDEISQFLKRRRRRDGESFITDWCLAHLGCI